MTASLLTMAEYILVTVLWDIVKPGHWTQTWTGCGLNFVVPAKQDSSAVNVNPFYLKFISSNIRMSGMLK